MGEKVTHKVDDRVTLSRPGRSLNQHSDVLFQPPHNLQLLFVGRQREQNVFRNGLLQRCAGIPGTIAGTVSHHLPERARERFALFQCILDPRKCIDDRMTAALTQNDDRGKSHLRLRGGRLRK